MTEFDEDPNAHYVQSGDSWYTDLEQIKRHLSIIRDYLMDDPKPIRPSVIDGSGKVLVSKYVWVDIDEVIISIEGTIKRYRLKEIKREGN